MKIKVKYRGNTVELEFKQEKITAKDILKALNLSSEYAFVARNGRLAGEEDKINPDDEIRVVNAISGG